MRAAPRRERFILRSLQGLVLGLPLVLGGNQPLVVALACAVVLVLLALTVDARRGQADAPATPGLGALATFVALALATTVPLPPALLGVLAPATAQLYRDTLPGWPGGGWSTWRPLAFDAYAVWGELVRLAIGFGTFGVLVAYPWSASDTGEDGRDRVFGRLVLTLFVGGALLGMLALVDRVAGNGMVMWVTAVPATSGRASGPFVNPNHFAGWLEMVIPVAFAYVALLCGQMRRRLLRAADAGRGMGVQRRRAWAVALITHQRRLWVPLVAGAAAVTMIAAHLATGSRGGAAALLVGLGVAGAGGLRATRRREGLARWLAPATAAALVLASVLSLALWAIADKDDGAVSTAEAADVSLASRLAVAVEGIGVVRDHALLGTGLGSWLHAFRPYAAPPVEGGIWDHAHNDYVELAAETGVVGFGVMLLFALAVVRASRARRPTTTAVARSGKRPAGFERPDWEVALADRSALRCGLLGGVAAMLVHSLVDFGLHIPANLLVLMVLLALLVLDGAPRVGRRLAATPALVVLLGVALVPQVANTVLVLSGRVPLAARDCRERAERLLAERGETARAEAVALVHRALDRSPADRENHEALAEMLGPGPEGDAALRRAVALEPWAVEVRDRLGLRLLAAGAGAEGVVEIEEAMFRFPYLVSHAYVGPDADLGELRREGLIREIADGNSIPVHLAVLDPQAAGAIEKGLRRALEQAPGGEARAAIVDDLATLLEARERWWEAAALLHAEAEQSTAVDERLARAARDFMKAKDDWSAEEVLLAAVLHAPERGDLYQQLAVDVYAARGDFPTAETVLHAGQRNALDMRPVYEGVTEVLSQRESARVRELAVARGTPSRPAGAEVVP